MIEIVLKSSQELVLREQNPLGEVSEIPLLTAAEAKKRMKCSLRQLYRHISRKRLKPAGKFLGQWVFRRKDVEFFHAPRRGRGAHLPEFLAPVFWSYRLSDVDPSSHAPYVVGQILEYGDLNAVRWAHRYYGLPYILRVAESHKELSTPTRNFWKLLQKSHANP